jgi:hypothetical protein
MCIMDQCFSHSLWKYPGHQEVSGIRTKRWVIAEGMVPDFQNHERTVIGMYHSFLEQNCNFMCFVCFPGVTTHCGCIFKAQ